MSNKYESDYHLRVKRKFYNKLLLQLDDLKSESRLSRPSDCSDSALKDVKEQDLYGVITKDELDLILKAYDEQQVAQGNVSNSIKCDGVRGGSFAKLLFSKPGFHHPGSTQILVDKLEIKERNRDSFLGGYSSFNPPEECSIKSLMDNQEKSFIREEAKHIYDLIEKGKDEMIDEFINRLIKVDSRNGDVLAVKGKWSLRCKQYDYAVRDLDSAMKNDCWDPKIIGRDLSKAYTEIGLTLYAGRHYRDAADKFTMALMSDEANETARFHLSMCQNHMSDMHRPFGTTNSFTSRRK